MRKVTGEMGRSNAVPRIQFLYLHYVYRDEERNFRRLLDRLAASAHFISYSDAVDRIASGRIDKYYVNFSFDDGLESCNRAAAILDEYGAKACFFLCPNVIEEHDVGKLERFCRERLHSPLSRFMDWNDIESLLRRGHEIGSHTKDHIMISETSASEMEDEVSQSKQLLESRVGPVKHFSWPYGTFAHFSPQGLKAVRASGYQTCASAVRGCHVTQAIRYDLCIRRDHVVAAWPTSHVEYFLYRNSMDRALQANGWPPEYAEAR